MAENRAYRITVKVKLSLRPVVQLSSRRPPRHTDGSISTWPALAPAATRAQAEAIRMKPPGQSK